jgi:soluble lytic murein transglycosylase-like protein
MTKLELLLGIPNWVVAIVLTTAAIAVSTALPVGDELQPRATPAPAAAPVAQKKPSPVSAMAHDLAALPSYIAKRWRIDLATAKRYVVAAQEASGRAAVDPLLVLAVIARESKFVFTGNQDDMTLNVDPMSVDPLRPHGPMQVSGRWHPEKMPIDKSGRIRPTTREENIHAGAEVLAEYLERDRGNLRRALQRYNGCTSDNCESYPAYVLRVRRQLQKVVEGV